DARDRVSHPRHRNRAQDRGRRRRPPRREARGGGAAGPARAPEPGGARTAPAPGRPDDPELRGARGGRDPARDHTDEDEPMSEITTREPAPVTEAPPKAEARRWIYFFRDGRAEGNARMRDLLGGKGAGLAEMGNAG